jgi:mRNA interferase RelE/StbE
MPRQGAASSSEFRIFETDEFARRLRGLQPRDPQALRTKLDTYVYPQLRSMPFVGANIRKLHGRSPDTWRYRIGKLRAFYTIDEEARVVFMLTIELRKDAYR